MWGVAVGLLFSVQSGPLKICLSEESYLHHPLGIPVSCPFDIDPLHSSWASTRCQPKFRQFEHDASLHQPPRRDKRFLEGQSRLDQLDEPESVL